VFALMLKKIIIRYVAFVLLTHPPENMTTPASIGAFATLAEHEGKGFGSAALKVALLYMKEHYLARNVRVLADTFEEIPERSAVTYWTKCVSRIVI
jgi:GNAT superfamily N-acetyltransferase